MTRKIAFSLIALAAPALGGCALQAALLAADAARYLDQGQTPSTALVPAATEACTKRGEQYGSVLVVYASPHRSGRIIVGGSVTDAQQRRRTFECHFTNTVERFKLNEILPAA